MTQWFGGHVSPTIEESDAIRQRLILNVVLAALAISSLFYAVVMAVQRGPASPGAIAGITPLPFFILAYWFGRRSQIRLGATLAASVLFVATVAALLTGSGGYAPTVGLIVVVLIAVILVGLRSAIIFAILSVLATAGAGLIISGSAIEASIFIDAVALAVGLAVLLTVFTLSFRSLRQTLSREIQASTELREESAELRERISRRTAELEKQTIQLRTAADIARLAAEMSTPRELSANAVELIQDRFAYYHVSIFMLDETGTWAELVASTGEAGKALLARHHRLAAGSASIVGWVTANRLPRISQVVTQDPFYFKNPLLPDTQSEMAMPMMIAQRLLGILDIQSSNLEAFADADVRAITAIADELAIAMDNARLMEAQQLELERADLEYRSRAGDSWERLSRSGLPSVLHLGPVDEGQAVGVDGFTTISQSAESGMTSVGAKGREVSLPVTVRGEVIATISLRKPDRQEPWGDDEIAMLEAVAGQAGLAIETARQYSDEQRRVTELEVINRVSQAASQLLRPETLFRVVQTQIDLVMGKSELIVALYDRQSQLLSFPYVSKNGETLDVEPTPIGSDLISSMIQTQLPTMTTADGAVLPDSMHDQDPPQSWLGAPLLAGDTILGAIVIYDQSTPDRYSEDDAALLSTLASQIATAMQNANLLEQVQRSARRERLIHEITAKVRRAPDVKTVLQTTARELGRALSAKNAFVRIGDGNPAADKTPEDQSAGSQEGSNDRD
jgi:GAF domain-containing protein